MNKIKILVVIPYRGIGDIIFHIPILKSLSIKYNSKINIITNPLNKAIDLIGSEKYINKIYYEKFDRQDLFRNSIRLLKRINNYHPDILLLTHGSKRLLWPITFFAKASKKKIFGRNKNNEDLAFFLIKQFKKKFSKIKLIKNYNLSNTYKSEKKIIFLNIDSHHNQNNWGEKNFVELTNKLIKKYFKHKIYINFSPRNKKFFKNILKSFKNKKKIFFSHNFPFKKIIKTISISKFVIGNESGPICISALMRKKTFSFYDKKTTAKSSKTIFNKVKMVPKKITPENFFLNLKKN